MGRALKLTDEEIDRIGACLAQGIRMGELEQLCAQAKLANRKNFLRNETSEWQTDRAENAVTCHSRVVDGVLCRWWGDDTPPGVAKIDTAAMAPTAPRAESAGAEPKEPPMYADLRDWWDYAAALCARVAELKAKLTVAEADAKRLDWLEHHVFEGKWDGTIGRPKSWHMAGPFRHQLAKMRGPTLRDALDSARSAQKEQTA